MARRDVPVFEGLKPQSIEDVRESLHALLWQAMGDEDKAGEIEAACYYEGVADPHTLTF